MLFLGRQKPNTPALCLVFVAAMVVCLRSLMVEMTEVFEVDHPFLVVLRSDEVVLFFGHVLEPSSS